MCMYVGGEVGELQSTVGWKASFLAHRYNHIFFFHKQIGLTNMKYTCSERRALCLQAAVNPSGQNLRMSKQTSLYS